MENQEKLIKSTVDKDDVSLPEESMEDFLSDLEESYDRMKAREVIDESAVSRTDPLLWQKFKEMMDESTVVTGKITEVNKGGAVMEVEGVRGFIPASKLAIGYVEDTETYLNKTVDAVIVDVDEEAQKLVLSVKDILLEKEREAKKARMESLQVGEVFEGKIASLKDYGAFVDIGDGIQGLLHISQISNERINNIRKVLKEGMVVKVAVTKIQDGKISLSMKAANSALAVEKADDEPREYSDHSQAVTSLGDLLKDIKF
ncbi:MAG: S1 RNA-binding domain-containing protein [Lachnospiraceae bacterium]|nr:S1 RNA-binding domain-containing protein [Lachnospiraceae bacterium]